MQKRTRNSRRQFLRKAAVSASFAIPTIIPRTALSAPGLPGANDRIAVGFIGCGNRARQLMSQLPAVGRIVAAADCELPRAEDAAKALGAEDWTIYQDYRQLLDKEEIDAAFVITPDHGRVLPCIHAVQSGRDVYAEKPLTAYIAEGRALVRAVRKHQRIFQVGTQQRTMEMNDYACRLVRSGGIGKVHTVLCRDYPGPRRYTGLPEEPKPPQFDWDMWCGPTELRPYNAQLHRGWMGWRSYSGGEMTNWGAHGLDQVQWALGMDGTGPVNLWLAGEGSGRHVRMEYDNGVDVRFELVDTGPMGGAIFIGDAGKIEINRNKFVTNPTDLAKDPPAPAKAEAWEGPGWIARPHMQNFFDCMSTRQRPNADVEIGHRSISVCHLVNITRELGRRLRWNPNTESFPDDDEANAMVTRPRREPYQLPAVEG